MEREVNEEKRNKFVEYAGKRVNNVLHDIQILEPMARSNNYDYTKQDIEEMFTAIQESLNDAKEEFYKKFEEKQKSAKKVFSFGSTPVKQEVPEVATQEMGEMETLSVGKIEIIPNEVEKVAKEEIKTPVEPVVEENTEEGISEESIF